MISYSKSSRPRMSHLLNVGQCIKGHENIGEKSNMIVINHWISE